MNRFALLLPLVVTAVTAACTTAPTHAPARASADDCDALRVELASAQEDKRAAEEKSDNAWKTVLPFAVAGRYAVGKAQANAADRQVADLSGRAAGKGCAL